MIRIYTLIISLLSVLSCTGGESAVFMLRPHEELPSEIASNKSFKTIFLAGTIDMGNSEDWQMETLRKFSGIPGRFILFNPRQEKWDASRPGEMEYQVNWELEHLEMADIIIMNILGNSKSPVSLLEMGLHSRSGKMYVICEPDYYRFENVRITCKFYGIPLYSSMDEFWQDKDSWLNLN